VVLELGVVDDEEFEEGEEVGQGGAVDEVVDVEAVEAFG